MFTLFTGRKVNFLLLISDLRRLINLIMVLLPACLRFRHAPLITTGSDTKFSSTFCNFTSSIRNITSTELYTYQLSDLLQYRTYDSCLFFFYLWFRLIMTISGPRAGDRTRNYRSINDHLF